MATRLDPRQSKRRHCLRRRAHRRAPRSRTDSGSAVPAQRARCVAGDIKGHSYLTYFAQSTARPALTTNSRSTISSAMEALSRRAARGSRPAPAAALLPAPTTPPSHGRASAIATVCVAPWPTRQKLCPCHFHRTSCHGSRGCAHFGRLTGITVIKYRERVSVWVGWA